MTMFDDLDEEPFDPEDEWLTVDVLSEDGPTIVWQGWETHLPDEPWFSEADAHIDEDGGAWAVAHPELCDIEQHHIPRVHPGAMMPYSYCVRCGEQGVNPFERADARLFPVGS